VLFRSLVEGGEHWSVGGSRHARTVAPVTQQDSRLLAVGWRAVESAGGQV